MSVLTLYRATLPALADCKGTFNMQSSGNISCDPFKTDKDKSIIKGSYFCASSSTNVQSTPGSGTGTSSGASASGTKGAAAISSVDVPAMVGLAGLVGAFVQMLI